MPRRREVPKRDVLPDPKYGNVELSKFMNVVMMDGKKSVAEQIIYRALDQISKKSGKDAVEIFNTAINAVKPMVEVKSRRVGGANYQVPREVRPERRHMLAARWIIDAARGKKGQPMHIKLAEELILASKNEGSAIKKREDTHKMADSNKAFAHFAW